MFFLTRPRFDSNQWRAINADQSLTHATRKAMSQDLIMRIRDEGWNRSRALVELGLPDEGSPTGGYLLYHLGQEEDGGLLGIKLVALSLGFDDYGNLNDVMILRD